MARNRSFGGIDEWHPLLMAVESDGECSGSLRTATTKDGSRQTEQLLQMDPARHFYRYCMETSASPVRDYIAELRIRDNGDGTSTVIWSADFEPMPGSPSPVEAIRAFSRSGLDNVAKQHRRDM